MSCVVFFCVAGSFSGRTKPAPVRVTDSTPHTERNPSAFAHLPPLTRTRAPSNAKVANVSCMCFFTFRDNPVTRKISSRPTGCGMARICLSNMSLSIMVLCFMNVSLWCGCFFTCCMVGVVGMYGAFYCLSLCVMHNESFQTFFVVV